MEMTLKGTPKEFAALVLELQERQDAEAVADVNKETYLAWKAEWARFGRTPAETIACCRAVGLTEYADRLEKVVSKMEESS